MTNDDVNMVRVVLHQHTGGLTLVHEPLHRFRSGIDPETSGFEQDARQFANEVQDGDLGDGESDVMLDAVAIWTPTNGRVAAMTPLGDMHAQDPVIRAYINRRPVAE